MGNIMDLLSHFTFLCFSFVCMGVRVSHVPQRVCVCVGRRTASKSQVSSVSFHHNGSQGSNLDCLILPTESSPRPLIEI